LASRVREIWARAGSLELGLTAGLAALAMIFALVGLILETSQDALSKEQVRGQVWQQVSIVLAMGALGWAVMARPGLRESPLLPGRADQLTLWVLAGGALVFIVVGFARSAGYDVLDDLTDGSQYSSLDEQAWLLFAFVWALVAFAWAVLTRPLDATVGRRTALIMTAVAGFFCIGALAIGNTGDDAVDTTNGIVRASAWYGVALVLMTLAAGSLFGHRRDG